MHQGDALAWLRAQSLPADHAIVTSLPDYSEVPRLGFEGWKGWFRDVAELACTQVAASAVTVFYQTDIKHDGRWIDKAYLVSRGVAANRIEITTRGENNLLVEGPGDVANAANRRGQFRLLIANPYLVRP